MRKGSKATLGIRDAVVKDDDEESLSLVLSGDSPPEVVRGRSIPGNTGEDVPHRIEFALKLLLLQHTRGQVLCNPAPGQTCPLVRLFRRIPQPG